MGREDHDAVRSKNSIEPAQEGFPTRRGEMREQRAASDEVVRTDEFDLVGIVDGVHRHRSERVGAVVDAVAIHVARGELCVRERGPQRP